MSVAPSRLNDDGADPSPGDAGVDDLHVQRLFVRVISARAAAPWDQARQAALEASLGAPVRLGDVGYRVRRLDGWRPGAEARFVVAYARAEDISRGLVARHTVEGREVVIDFSSPLQRLERLRAMAVFAAALLVLALGLVVATGQVMGRRAALDASLQDAERIATGRLTQANELVREKRQAQALDQQGLRNRSMEAVLKDIAWVSRAKATGAHIQALHWDHGFVAVEASGDANPFALSDRAVQKAKAPVRPGVWLWGVDSLDPWQESASPRTSASRGPAR